jgi:hypothetical protein
MAHVLDNNGGDRVHFTPNELTQFNTELNSITIQGARLPQGVLALSGVEAPPKR